MAKAGKIQADQATGKLPFFCGDLDIRIAADGTWFHDGRPIRRPALVKLFASVLKRDAAGDYWLVTPFERARIKVDDAPFQALELAVEGAAKAQILRFRTNADEWVEIGPSHPVRLGRRPIHGDLAPYVLVREGLEALVARTAYYALAALIVEAEERGVKRPGVWSGGTFFPLALDSET